MLGEEVTDVLVTRGNHEVAVTRRRQSRREPLSDLGYSRWLRAPSMTTNSRSEFWMRPDMPRQHLLKLIMVASAALQRRLEASDRRNAQLFRDLVAEAREQILAQARNRSADYPAIEARLKALHRDGMLGEAQLAGFAHARKFDESRSRSR